MHGLLSLRYKVMTDHDPSRVSDLLNIRFSSFSGHEQENARAGSRARAGFKKGCSKVRVMQPNPVEKLGRNQDRFQPVNGQQPNTDPYIRQYGLLGALVIMGKNEQTCNDVTKYGLVWESNRGKNAPVQTDPFASQ